MKLSKKIPVSVALLVTLAVLSVGVTAIVMARSALHKSSEKNLESIVDSREIAIEVYLESIKNDIDLLSANESTQMALNAFTSSYKELGGGDAARNLYVKENPNKGKLQDYMGADDGSAYSLVHKKYHAWLKTYVEKQEYYDFFFITPEGDIVYTYYKEPDYGTNLATGPWNKSNLAKLWKALADSKGSLSHAFVDFEPYAPSAGAPASFMGVPVMIEGKFAGVLAIQMPVGKINAIMQRVEGMGETGDAYIVGEDFKMRTDSRFVKKGETSILRDIVKTDAVVEALAGKSGSMLALSNEGLPALIVYEPIVFQGVKWAVIGEFDASEIFQDAQSMQNMLLLLSFLVLAFALALGWFGSGTLTKPIAALADIMRVMSKGDYNVKIPATERVDELGDMAQAADGFRLKLIEGRELAKKQREEQERQIKRAEKLGVAVSAFEKVIVEIVGTVSSASTELQATSQSLAATAEETSHQASAVAAASEQLTQNVQTVASATEELTSSIHEIGGQITESTHIINDAVSQAGDANNKVQQLSQAAQKIGEVVTLINEIASQTNLLALNATIEAARAGEAGKGFAVVASEVKELATQTAKATDEIAAQILSMQNSTGSTAKAIEDITQTIGRVNSISTAIAAAIEEQGSATQEISRNVQEASMGTNEVAQNVVGVKESSQETSAGSVQVHSAASELAKSGDRLKQEVNAFLATIQNL